MGGTEHVDTDNDKAPDEGNPSKLPIVDPKKINVPQVGGGPELSQAEVKNTLTVIRHFQLLSQDCENMRDTAAKLSPEVADEQFPGTSAGKKLNCYKNKGEEVCQ